MSSREVYAVLGDSPKLICVAIIACARLKGQVHKVLQPYQGAYRLYRFDDTQGIPKSH